MDISKQLMADLKHQYEAGNPSASKIIGELKKSVNHYRSVIREMDNAVDYCKKYDIDFSNIDDAMSQYEDRMENTDYLDDLEQERALDGFEKG